MKRKHREAQIAMGIQLAGLEEIVRRHKICIDAHNTRLSEHDDDIEAMNETIDQLSECKCGVGGELMGRVKNLEVRTGLDRDVVANHSLRLSQLEGKYNRMDAAISALAKERDERITALEQSNEKMNDLLGRSLEKINQALELTNRRYVVTEMLQQQVKEINSRLTALTNKYLELRPKKQLETGTTTGDPINTPQVNLLAVKKPRKVKV